MPLLALVAMACKGGGLSQPSSLVVRTSADEGVARYSAHLLRIFIHCLLTSGLRKNAFPKAVLIGQLRIPLTGKPMKPLFMAA